MITQCESCNRTVALQYQNYPGIGGGFWFYDCPDVQRHRDNYNCPTPECEGQLLAKAPHEYYCELCEAMYNENDEVLYGQHPKIELLGAA